MSDNDEKFDDNNGLTEISLDVPEEDQSTSITQSGKLIS